MEAPGLVILIGVTFSYASPMQSKDHCQPPQRMELAEVLGDLQETFPPNHILTFICRPGYVRLGTLKMICKQGTWQWLGGGQCRKKRCENPGEIEFGTFELKNEEEFVFGAIIEYSCNPGYQMISKYKTIECTANGWSNAVPSCEAKLCPAIEDQSVRVLSYVYDEEYTVGHVIDLQCKNPNHKLTGPSQIYCTSNGTWNINPPTCKGHCIVQRDKMVQNNIRVKTFKNLYYAHDEVIEFQCIPGYAILDPKKLSMRCNIRGMITYPTCHRTALTFSKRTCPPPPTIPFGELMGEKKYAYDSGSSVHYKCLSYFKLAGKQTIKCLNGQWEMSPACYQPCVLNYLYIHGNHTVANRKDNYIQHGDTVTFECLPSFKIPPHKTLTAKCSRGKLIYPRCVKIKPCILNKSIILKNNITIQSKSDLKRIKENETIEFECLPRYDISDREKLKVKCHNEIIEYPSCFKISADETTAQPSMQTEAADETTAQPSMQTEILATDYTRI